MTAKRFVALALSVLLLVFRGWSFFAAVGDVRTRVMLGIGAILGLAYTYYGELPSWLIDASGGSITDDDDPSNISPRVYLPILLIAILIAVIGFVIALRFL